MVLMNTVTMMYLIILYYFKTFNVYADNPPILIIIINIIHSIQHLLQTLAIHSFCVTRL